MNEIINLNKKRKEKAKLDKERKAAENRRKFGRSKAEKQRETIEKNKLKSHIEGHQRETKDD